MRRIVGWGIGSHGGVGDASSLVCTSALGKTILVAVGTFIPTVISDILILTILYAESLREDCVFRPIHVVIGEFLGITIVIAIR